MSSIAYLNLRKGVPDRKSAFVNGLSALGYKVHSVSGEVSPRKGDIFVTWNRIGKTDSIARKFEVIGCSVLVVENASWGNVFAGLRWYHMSRKYHNQATGFPVLNNSRWDNLCCELQPWRDWNGETVILLQRGIGPARTRMPASFANQAKQKHAGARVRKHPGTKDAVSLESDLKDASHVVTWGSGAAIKALMWGIPVTSYLKNWIGEQDNTNQGRLEMFRRLAWAQWTLEEINSGFAFRHLL